MEELAALALSGSEASVPLRAFTSRGCFLLWGVWATRLRPPGVWVSCVGWGGGWGTSPGACGLGGWGLLIWVKRLIEVLGQVRGGEAGAGAIARTWAVLRRFGGGCLHMACLGQVCNYQQKLWNKGHGGGGLAIGAGLKVCNCQQKLWNRRHGGGGLAIGAGLKVCNYQQKLWNKRHGGGGLVIGAGLKVCNYQQKLWNKRHGGGGLMI